jgi:purine-binding chemotaxis protein CheW
VNHADQKINSENKYSVIKIDGQLFAIDIKNVKEVIPAPLITKLPNVADTFLGVFNLRGKIYSVIDLRALLGMLKKKTAKTDFLMIVENEKSSLGFIAKNIGVMRWIDSNKIQLPTKDFTALFVKYLHGYVEDKKIGQIFILDIPAIFTAKEINQYNL